MLAAPQLKQQAQAQAHQEQKELVQVVRAQAPQEQAQVQEQQALHKVQEQTHTLLDPVMQQQAQALTQAQLQLQDQIGCPQMLKVLHYLMDVQALAGAHKSQTSMVAIKAHLLACLAQSHPSYLAVQHQVL